ncbi:hypothetical protein [Bosea caraganae]|nr:hypothetical protein [Bosea caraganae]
MLTSRGKEIGRASYDFDGFFRQPVGVTSCGEIQLAAPILKEVFGRKDLQLLTDDGRRLDLTFSEKKLARSSDVAHVDVTGELPKAPRNWRH